MYFLNSRDAETRLCQVLGGGNVAATIAVVNTSTFVVEERANENINSEQ